MIKDQDHYHQLLRNHMADRSFPLYWSSRQCYLRRMFGSRLFTDRCIG
eukprot:UN12672